jgi:Transposase IS116/IS110/IS902 family
VLTEAAGIVEPLQLLLAALIAQLQVLLPSIAKFDANIEALFATHPNAALFAALPGAVPQLAPRLLVAFGEERSRCQSAQDLLRYAGIAPVKECSGQKSWVHWRSLLSQILETNLCGMGITNSQTLLLGRGVLPDATTKGKNAPGCDPCARIQMDTHCLPLLARQTAL